MTLTPPSSLILIIASLKEGKLPQESTSIDLTMQTVSSLNPEL
jgi:hypothetical protein